MKRWRLVDLKSGEVVMESDNKAEIMRFLNKEYPRELPSAYQFVDMRGKA